METPTLSCMEVWGGNQATSRSFQMLGLEAWIYSQPYQEASGGGDVYFISTCATGRITRLLVADLSGHGASVAATGERLRALMRQHVNHIEQRHFVSELNREFGTVRHAGGFATAVAASFFSPDRQIRVTNAGHPPPLVYTAASRQWKILEVPQDEGSGLSDMPLGMLDEMDYREFHVATSPGDLILFYTDSLVEARQANGQLLGAQGLLTEVSQLEWAQPEELIPRLLTHWRALHQENLLDDDVTVLLFRPTGTGQNVPVVNRLLAPWRFLAACIRAIVRLEPLPLPEFTWANLGGSLLDIWSSGKTPSHSPPRP